MQTCEAIGSPSFTGLWRGAGDSPQECGWHVKHNGVYVGWYQDLECASRALERRVRQFQLKRLQCQLAHAARLNALRLGQN